MPNLDPWINQFENDQRINTIATTTLEEEKNKFENYLLFVKSECLKTIERNSHQYPTFLENYQNIIEMIEWWTRMKMKMGNSIICNMWWYFLY